MRPPLALDLETAAFRSAGRALAPRRPRRRHDPPRQAALEARSGRDRPPRRRLPHGSALVSATNGKTTTTAMVAEILAPGMRLAHNASGANLLSGVASTLLAVARRRARAVRGRRGGAAGGGPASCTARGRCLGNLFRDQLDRYGELEHVAAPLARGASPGCPTAALVVNADDPLVGDLADGREQRARLRPRRPRARPPVAPARGRLEVLPALRDAVRLRRGLRRPSRRLPLPALRPRPPAARRRGPRDRAARARRRVVHARRRPRGRRASSSACPGSTTSTTPSAAASLALALGAPLDGDRRRARALHGRVRPVRADRGRRPEPADAADQEPGRRERGRAHARRRPRPHGSRWSR